ncbi:MAG: VWA domain-containing protein [Planctomycetales bacterium]|nr:VWA domain-containing protein [Planctomycetales bacterium]
MSSVPPSGSRSRGRTQARHRWQGQETLRGQFLATLHLHGVKVLWTTLFGAALLLFIWLIWLLIFAPKRTPLVVLAAAPYSWPLPPNAWATEDFQKLAALDGKNITLSGSDEPLRSKGEFLARLEREVQQSHAQPSNLPLILWVSMHGVAFDATEDSPHSTIQLIPPQASPTDPTQWIDFDELTERLSQLPSGRPTLLILDCQRMQVNWNIGLMANHFSQRVQQALAKQAHNKLAIFLTAGPEEQAAVSCDLLGSTFGHYFRQALAGAADSHAETGNGDGWVSLSEMHAYVRQQVEQWSLQNRAVLQSPLLLVHPASVDFRLARSLNHDSLSQLLETDRRATAKEPTLSSTRLDGLWRRLDELRKLQLYQREPLAWRDLEHRLLWLEQLATSGDGYRSTALRTLDDVEGQLEAIQQRVTLLQQTRSLRDSATVLSGDNWSLPQGLRMHSLPLAQYFATPQAAAGPALRQQFEKFYSQPTPQRLSETLADLPRTTVTEFADGRFLHMLARYQFPDLWQQPQALGQLLRLRAEMQRLAVPHDSQGLPGNERVHAWTRQLLTHVQRARRQAEDGLFIQGQPRFAQSLQEAQALYEQALTADQSLQLSLATCDRAMAETTYLAQWLSHPLHRADPQQSRQTFDERLLPLVKDTKQLSQLLANHPPAETTFADVLRECERVQRYAASRVQQPLQSLSDDWQDWCRQLLNRSEADPPEAVGELEAVLSVPLARWESRRELRSARQRLTARLHTHFSDSRGLPPTDASLAKPTLGHKPSDSTYSARLAAWQPHPLQAIVALETPLPAGVTSPQAALLQQLESHSQRPLGDSSQPAAAPATSLAAQLAACRAAADRFRAAAPLWFDMPPRNPLHELRHREAQSLLLWQAESALNDFWGPAGDELAFFDVATSDYLAAATEFARLLPTGQEPHQLAEFDSLAGRLAASRQAAAGWLTTEAHSTVQLAPKEPVTATIAVRAKAAPPGFQPPQGVATVFVQDTHGRLPDTLLEPSGGVSLPQAETELSLNLPARVAAANADLRAQAMFRGHEYSAALPVPQLGGRVIDFTPNQYQTSQVTLNGPWQKLSVAFILDCSHSMQDALAADGPAPATSSRLEVAQAALQEMMLNLGLRQDIRVGLHFFGHRLGWSTDSPLRAVPRPDYSGTLPPGLTPSRDVETVLPQSSFDLAAAQAILPRISGVKPWGQSPLYLSVVQALRDFGTSDAQAERHIIVVTDGANYQYIPASESDVQATNVTDVHAAWAQQPVPVHILGLGMERTEDHQAIEEFTQLCRGTGGHFQALTSSTDLRRALDQLLNPGRYQLLGRDAAQPPQQEAGLGTPIRLAPAPKTTEPFWVSYHGHEPIDVQAKSAAAAAAVREEVWFEGGEALLLYVDEQGTAICAYPFQDNVAAQGTLITQHGAATDHVLRVHQPRRGPAGSLQLPISWQRRDTRAHAADSRWRVTQRPAQVWAELQPLSANKEPLGPAYVFYDANYEADQPVPVMQLVAGDWPAAGVKAELRLWCQPPGVARFELPPPPSARATSNTGSASPVASAELDSTLAFRDALESPLTVAPQVTLRAQRLLADADQEFQRLRFILQFHDDHASVTSLKLSVPTTAPVQPARVVRQFDTAHRLAVHTFYFRQPVGELSEVIELTNRQHELDGAWQLQQGPLIVDVAEAGNFLPVLDPL